MENIEKQEINYDPIDMELFKWLIVLTNKYKAKKIDFKEWQENILSEKERLNNPDYITVIVVVLLNWGKEVGAKELQKNAVSLLLKNMIEKFDYHLPMLPFRTGVEIEMFNDLMSK